VKGRSNRLAAVGLRRDALSAIGGAVDIDRELIMAEPEIYRRDLSDSAGAGNWTFVAFGYAKTGSASSGGSRRATKYIPRKYDSCSTCRNNYYRVSNDALAQSNQAPDTPAFEVQSREKSEGGRMHETCPIRAMARRSEACRAHVMSVRDCLSNRSGHPRRCGRGSTSSSAPALAECAAHAEIVRDVSSRMHQVIAGRC
jgi:hypothetical protein